MCCYRLWLELEETKPVQRTSSLKTEKRKRGYRKDRDSERRKTCQPVLHTVSSSLQTGATSGEEGEVKEGEGVTYALQIGSEVVEMEPGKVLKQKRGLYIAGFVEDCGNFSAINNYIHINEWDIITYPFLNSFPLGQNGHYFPD